MAIIRIRTTTHATVQGNTVVIRREALSELIQRYIPDTVETVFIDTNSHCVILFYSNDDYRSFSRVDIAF